MRQIKFRAWDGEEMLKDWLVLKDTGGGVFPVTLTRKAGVVMQYTGLIDKNGKEIYEGDIVKWEDSIYKGGLAQIVWDTDGWIVLEGKSNNIFNFYSPDGRNFSWDDLEIIGNIYENPELLVQLDK